MFTLPELTVLPASGRGKEEEKDVVSKLAKPVPKPASASSVHLVPPTPLDPATEAALVRLGTLGFAVRPMGTGTAFSLDDETLCRLVDLLDRLLARVT